MLYGTALRYSEPYFSHDVSSVEHVLRNKDEGSCTMTQNICFFGIMNCDPLVTRMIIGKSYRPPRYHDCWISELGGTCEKSEADMHSVHVTYDRLL